MDYLIDIEGGKYQPSLIKRILEESEFLSEQVPFQIEGGNEHSKERNIKIDAILFSGTRYIIEDNLCQGAKGTKTKSSRYILNKRQISKVS